MKLGKRKGRKQGDSKDNFSTFCNQSSMAWLSTEQELSSDRQVFDPDGTQRANRHKTSGKDTLWKPGCQLQASWQARAPELDGAFNCQLFPAPRDNSRWKLVQVPTTSHSAFNLDFLHF